MDSATLLKHLDRAIDCLQAARAAVAAGRLDQIDLSIGTAQAACGYILTKRALAGELAPLAPAPLASERRPHAA